MKVPYVNLGLQYSEMDLSEIQEGVRNLLLRGDYILGSSVEEFEKNFASFCGARFAVGVANGTDALILSLKAIGLERDDEVITASNSYLATATSIVMAGGVPVFADVASDYNIDSDQIEGLITSKTKAIIPVHLTGNPARMDEIKAIAQKHNLAVIEDAAQAVGAEYKGRVVGSIGDLGCFSLHPLKNLGAPGDAGIITTNDENLYKFLIKARNHGLKNRDECEFVSLNSRLDSIHALVLNVKMRHLKEWNAKRFQNAQFYNKHLSPFVEIPKTYSDDSPVFHAYVIQVSDREALIKHLSELNIDVKVHYPIPIHKQKAMENIIELPINLPETERQMKRILSLPIYPELTNDQLRTVVDGIISFYN